jgi:hypothetical protein
MILVQILPEFGTLMHNCVRLGLLVKCQFGPFHDRVLLRLLVNASLMPISGFSQSVPSKFNSRQLSCYACSHANSGK